jgi:hypothetical protein
MRRAAFSIAVLCLLPGCFWGSSEANLFVTISASNFEEYEDLLYPEVRADAWADLFEARPSVCAADDGSEDCDGGVYQRSDLVELFVPYETDRTRAVITQKGDLQITAHLKVGVAYEVLAADGFEDLNYLETADDVYAKAGDGCTADISSPDRTGVGRCLKAELSDHSDDYGELDEDLRLVILINLPGEDDVRSTSCQDRETDFASEDWDYPRTFKVNYSAHLPDPEDDPDRYTDSEGDEPPLPQCDIEVFARIQLGFEIFSAEYFGENSDSGFEIDTTNEPCTGSDCPNVLLGTVELEDLVLPGEDGSPHASGRFRIAFSSDRFAVLDGRIEAIGSFDTQVRRDPEELEEPERQLDLDDDTGGL